MKTLKIIAVTILIWTMACLPAPAVLTATVNPGYTLSTGETPTTAKLNQLGQPTVTISGSVDGSTGLTAGSVAGNLLADSVPDGVTLNYNGGAPRQLQIANGGASSNQINTNTFGRGLLGGYATGPASGTVVSVNLDGTTLVFTASGALSISSTFLAGVFFTYPLTPNYTNLWGYTQAFNITNFNITVPTNNPIKVTNIWNGFVTIKTNNTQQAIADADQIPLLNTLQQTNTTMTPKALAGYAQYKASQDGSTIVYTNLHRVTGYYYGGGDAAVSLAAATPLPLYQNTNTDFSVVVDASGSWSSTAGNTFKTYVADEGTNQVQQIDSGTTSSSFSTSRYILPPHYGVYLLRTAGSGTATGTYNIRSIPW